MNSCEYYQELICRLIDGELSEEGRAVLARHLRECPECAAVYDAFAGISQAMGDDMQEPPADMAANIMAQIRRSTFTELNGENKQSAAVKSSRANKHTGKKKGVPGGVKVLLSAAACLALVVAAAFTLPIFRGADTAVFGLNSPAVQSGRGTQSAKAGDVDAEAGMVMAAEPQAPAAMADDAMDAAPMEAAPAQAASLEEEAEEEVIVSNVYKVEILYAGELIEDFTMRTGEAPVRLTGKIYPISVEDSPNWSSSDQSVVTVTAADDGSCVVEAVGAGSAKVIAEYAGKTGECWVRVAVDSEAPPAEGLEMHYAGSKIYEFTMHVGDANIPLKAVVDRELLTGDIIWSSTDDSVIRVHDTNDGWCVVEAVDEGSASVVLECGEMKVRCKVYVVELPKEQ